MDPMRKRALDAIGEDAYLTREPDEQPDDADTNPSLPTLPAVSPDEWLTQRISEAQTLDQRERAEQAELERIERENQQRGAIEERESELRTLISEAMRFALSMRYEPYQNADRIWRAKAVFTFDGQELELFRSPYSDYRLYDQNGVTGAQLLAELFISVGASRFEHNLCLALADYRERLQAIRSSDD